MLELFRANTFFRNFEIQGAADRLLVYGIWFVSDCLGKIKPHMGVRDATKDVTNLALDLNFAIPGDPGWPLNQVSLFFLSDLPLQLRCYSRRESKRRRRMKRGRGGREEIERP